MKRGWSFLALQCAECHKPLIRVAESEANDKVYCPNCLAWGSYKEIVEQSHGLSNLPILDQELMDFIQERWIARELSGKD